MSEHGTGPILSVNRLQKSYDGFVAVRQLSFELVPGDILAMVGPNGAGKTTTMRAICGILTPTSGSIVVGGHDLRTDPIAAKSAQAYVPDDPKLFDNLTVWEHLSYIAATYRVRDWKDRAERLIEMFELTSKRQALAMELSRGMRQKVAIACAYLHDPRLIMLDEPLTGLDPMGIRVMKQTIRDRAGAGAAVIVSSHLLSLVEDLATRVLIMTTGEKRFDGTIAEARATFAAGKDDASLEEVFFSATAATAAPDSSATTGSVGEQV